MTDIIENETGEMMGFTPSWWTFVLLGIIAFIFGIDYIFIALLKKIFSGNNSFTKLVDGYDVVRPFVPATACTIKYENIVMKTEKYFWKCLLPPRVLQHLQLQPIIIYPIWEVSMLSMLRNLLMWKIG